MEQKFKIEGMSCGHCVMAVEKSLNQLNLIKKKVKIGSAKVKFDPEIVSELEIKNKIEEAGYKVVQ
ncbi:cation transporter [bacterium BMS3Abin03]|jgi:copper chaperone|nr:cation transporter [bacterium BMS3Abin03]MCG6959009.1 cation transporter [bacterium BMS3Abin03]